MSIGNLVMAVKGKLGHPEKVTKNGTEDAELATQVMKGIPLSHISEY